MLLLFQEELMCKIMRIEYHIMLVLTDFECAFDKGLYRNIITYSSIAKSNELGQNELGL